MNYTKIYNQLIERAKNRKEERDGYYERHHIIPKCMGGSDDKDNLVKLTYREHFIAHWLLHRENPDNKSLAVGFHIMAFGMGRGNVRKKRNNGWIPSSRQLEEARIASVIGSTGRIRTNETKKKIGDFHRGKVESEETKEKKRIAHLGKKLSEETKQKLREINLGNTHSLGKKHSEETKAKMSKWQIGKKLSEETKQKIGKASLGRTSMLGKKHSEETKQKISEAKRGKKLSEDHKQKMSESRLGKQWITNGIDNRMINQEEELPIGWRYGRMKPNTIVNNKWW